MKKTFLSCAVIAVLLLMISCKGKKQEVSTSETQTTSTSSTTTPAIENADNKNTAAPKTFKVLVAPGTPDTILLGKNKEASVKIKELKAIELADPDGKVTGTLLSYKIELTNKNAIGGNAIGLPTTNFRLELDNGNKIAPKSVFVSAEPEATKLSEEDTFTIPAGAKPTTLILFYDETRVSIKLMLD